MRFILNVNHSVIDKTSLDEIVSGVPEITVYHAANLAEAEKLIEKYYFSVLFIQHCEKEDLFSLRKLMPQVDSFFFASNPPAELVQRAYEQQVTDVMICSHSPEIMSTLIVQRLKRIIEKRNRERTARIMNSLILNLPAQVLVIRHQTEHASKVVFANSNFLQFQGYRPFDIIGNSIDLAKRYQVAEKKLHPKSNSSVTLRDVKLASGANRNHWFDVHILEFSDPYNPLLSYSVVVELDQSYYKTREPHPGKRKPENHQRR